MMDPLRTIAGRAARRFFLGWISLLRGNDQILQKEREDRQRATEELLHSQTQHRLVVENANDAIFLLLEDRIHYPNPRTMKMLGYTAEELAGRPFAEFLHPEDRDAVLEKIQALRGNQNKAGNYSFRLLDHRGHEVWVQGNDVLTSWEGQPAVLCCLRDISLEKRLQEQIVQSQKMEAIGTLAGGIAHDFNNLLTGIQGRTSLMLLDIDENHPHHRDLLEIDVIVRQAVHLTRQLLDFARGGKRETLPLDLNGVLRDTLTMFGRTRKEIRIHERLAQDLPAVLGDRGQLTQLFLNLFVNAGQAMPSGGTLDVETGEMLLHDEFARLHGVTPGRFLKIVVTDTGVGMDEATKQRIFDPFFTTRERETGTGLGLASAYGIVKGHGGLITVQSEKGQGTAFTVFLPATDLPAARDEKVAATALRGSETILLVDDEEVVLEAGRLMLRILGYKVLTARSAVEALSIYKGTQHDTDLVILDIVMPGMEGAEAYQAFKTVNPGVRVLLTSGYGIDDQARGILAQGAEAFIQKPYSIKDLSVKIRQVLDR